MLRTLPPIHNFISGYVMAKEEKIRDLIDKKLPLPFMIRTFTDDETPDYSIDSYKSCKGYVKNLESIVKLFEHSKFVIQEIAFLYSYNAVRSRENDERLKQIEARIKALEERAAR